MLFTDIGGIFPFGGSDESMVCELLGYCFEGGVFLGVGRGGLCIWVAVFVD
jgi:hypothetical protein